MAQLVTTLDLERLRSNLENVRQRIAAACRRSGRRPDAVELLAATKYVPSDLMGTLADAGIALAGENTAQSLAEKHARWSDRLTFDFIGHLQSRKTKDVLPLVRLIHSVESESVLSRIDRHAEGPVNVLVEVNVSGETSKHGVATAEIDSFIEKLSSFEKVAVAGLLTMPPAADNPEDARPYFAALRSLAERLDRDWAPGSRFRTLSMGTSQDYEVAVEEGATIVRLGSVLYA